jgi:hypothetical protein
MNDHLKIGASYNGYDNIIRTIGGIPAVKLNKFIVFMLKDKERMEN